MLLTSPSLAPKTAARKVPDIRARPRAASPRTTSPWIRSSASHRRRQSHRGGQRPALGLLHQRQHEHPTEPPRQDGQQPRPQAWRAGAGRPDPQPALPVRRVPLLGLGQPEQDLALLALAAQGQIAVDAPPPARRRAGAATAATSPATDRTGPTALVLHRGIVPEHGHRGQPVTTVHVYCQGGRRSTLSAVDAGWSSRRRRARGTARP